MPSLTIKTRAGRTVQQKQTLMRCLREALLEAFEKGDSGCYVWLEEYAADHCLLPEGEADCIAVQVFCFGGRSQQAKDRFYRLAAQKLDSAGEKTENLVITVADPALGDWGLSGQNAQTFLGRML